MAQPTDRLARHDRFVTYVQQACRADPGKRAALRRGLGRRPEQAHAMHAVLARWVDGARAAQERAYYTVASLIAAQSGTSPEPVPAPAPSEQPEADRAAAVRARPSLGSALGVAALAARDDCRTIAAGSAERRLHLLARQHVDGVHRHLPAVVRHLRASGVPVDWAQLIEDLSRWPYDRDRIAKRWLQDYYRTAQPPDSDDEDEQEHE